MKIDPIHRRAIEDFVRSNALDAVVHAMKQQYFADFAATQSAEASKRELIYAQVNALEDFRATLGNFLAEQAVSKQRKLV